MTEKEFNELNAFEQMDALIDELGAKEVIDRIFKQIGYWKMYDMISVINYDVVKEEKEEEDTMTNKITRKELGYMLESKRLELTELGSELVKKMIIENGIDDVYTLSEKVIDKIIKGDYDSNITWLSSSPKNVWAFNNAMNDYIIDDMKDYDLIEYTQATRKEVARKEFSEQWQVIEEAFLLEWLVDIKQVESIDKTQFKKIMDVFKKVYPMWEVKDYIEESLNGNNATHQ